MLNGFLLSRAVVIWQLKYLAVPGEAGETDFVNIGPISGNFIWKKKGFTAIGKVCLGQEVRGKRSILSPTDPVT